MPNKQDSNQVGTRIAQESSIGVLPGTPIWYPVESNSFGDFGATFKKTPRNTINESRQNRKGATTDMDANGSINVDLTYNAITRLMCGYMFADPREKKQTAGLDATATAITSTTSGTKTYAAASGLNGFVVGALILAEGFAVAANNGIKTVATSAAAALTVNETIGTEAAPPAAAKLTTVGQQGASGDLAITMNGNLCQLTSVALDFTTLGLIPGEWIYLGGDTTPTRFANNRGWARIMSIAAHLIVFDKVSWTPQAEVGTGLTIQMFFGTVIKNESTPALIKRRTYQVERTLGNDGSGIQSEYLTGAVPNTLKIGLKQGDKVMVDLDFVATGYETRTGTVGVKSGTRPALTSTDAYNAADHLDRMRLSLVDVTASSVTPLFAFATDASLEINNGITPNKALGRLSAFDASAGNFTVKGNVTAYFGDITALAAIQANSDVTLDLALTAANKGLLFDLPLVSLGGGKLNVSKDQPIMLPIDAEAAAYPLFDHTMLYMSYAYLPTAAMG